MSASRHPFATLAALPLLLLLAAGCGSTVGGRLRDAHAASRVPEGLVVVYTERSAHWGGRRVEVSGDGSVVVTAFRPGFVEAGEGDDPLATVGAREGGGDVTFEGHAPAGALSELVATLVTLEAWKQRAALDEGRLDPSRATLSLRVGDAETSVWEFYDDLEANDRLVRVRASLDVVVRAAIPGSEASVSAPPDADR